ncbi:MAG: sugar ABC transporter substrate-binding protein [Chloroflexi bacterium]|nr:sugar ABC transporter substrate-binding protein [Chloroflexota bacterium]
MSKNSRWLSALMIFALLALVSINVAVAQDGITELTILWAEWDPANYLQQIGNEYEAETGIKVNVIQEPWGSFYDRMAVEWAAQGDAYDMTVGDSQWIGQAVEQGHYLDLTDFLVSNGIDKTVTPATLQYYGEYPAGSGKYYAYPTEGDAVGWAYRKDLFEDPQNMADFEAKYGRPLQPPETWAELRDIAEFFTRPDDGIYGVGVYTQKDYDGMVMGFQNVFFSWGADWSRDGQVMGVVNSPEAVEALEFYKGLYQFAPPGTGNAFFAEMNDVFISGQAAMIMNYFAFFPALINPGVNPYAEVTGFFPGPKGPNGDQFVSLGGQGLSILSYISPERQEASKEFIKWFAQEEVQRRWAAVGGYTCNINVLESEEFLTNTPYNAAFADSMTFVKDFWNIPQFGELLEPAQTYLTGFVVGGEGTAQEAMDNIAEAQHEILVDAGVIDG